MWHEKYLFSLEVFCMSTVLGSVSYSISSENTLLESAADLLDMKNQIEVKKQKVNTWTIVRNYQSKFSCTEVIE